jgi:hypothetical protein
MAIACHDKWTCCLLLIPSPFGDVSEKQISLLYSPMSDVQGKRVSGNKFIYKSLRIALKKCSLQPLAIHLSEKIIIYMRLSALADLIYKNGCASDA